jgi:hypothetical protein
MSAAALSNVPTTIAGTVVRTPFSMPNYTPSAPSRPFPAPPVPRPSRPQPRTSPPRWSRRHSRSGTGRPYRRMPIFPAMSV